MARAYLDNNASSPALPEVVEAVARALRLPGNPSSLHASGREARAALSEARERVAAVLHSPPGEIVFTSGGTEADNLAVLGGARAAAAAGAARRVVISSVEHAAVEAAAAALADEGFSVERVPVDGDGLVDPGAFAAAARGASLAALLLVQNETGGIQPVADAFAAVREASPLTRLHADAVQALGKVPVPAVALGADTVAVSAHKVHGPRGVGALWIRPGREPRPRALGGKQERGLRTGTENLPGAIGFGAAAAALLRDGAARAAATAALGALLEETILSLPGARLLGPRRPRRVPGTLLCAFEGVRGDILAAALDGEGVDVSTGSACASGAARPSPVLEAMGVDPGLARGAVRFSLGALSTEDDVRRAAAALRAVLPRVRAAAAAFGSAPSSGTRSP